MLYPNIQKNSLYFLYKITKFINLKLLKKKTHILLFKKIFKKDKIVKKTLAYS